MDRAEAIALSTNLGTDSARLYPTLTAKNEIFELAIYRTLHSSRLATLMFPHIGTEFTF
jgi:hypothetical protein